ncbi:energy transducer TonB [Phreatobacter sp. HK31-P]
MPLDSDIAMLDPPAPTGAVAPAVALNWPTTSTPPPVVLPASGETTAAPPLSVVPAGVTISTAAAGRLRTVATAIASFALHGALVAPFLTYPTPSPPRGDLPAIEIEMVEPEAEPPPAAAAPPQEVAATETPPVEIEPPPLKDLPLPPELLPPEPVAEEPQPIELPPPPEPQAALPDELRPQPVVAAVEPTPIVIAPPPLSELPLPAELLPPPPAPPRRTVEERPRHEARSQPQPRRQEMVREAPRRPLTPRPVTPPSAASAGRGVTSRQSARTSSPPPTYLARVIAQLHRAKPAGSGQQGRAVVRFAIQRSGAAGGVALASSSGNAAIDQAALSMVRRAAPFPPLPPEYAPETMALTVPIAFR